MFGFKRRKATRTAIDALAPFIRTLEMTGGLPSGFWRDPFVLGFFQGGIAIFATISSGGKIKGEELGWVVMDVLATLAGAAAMPAAKLAGELGMAGDAEFTRGATAADKIISYAYGQDIYDNDPAVLAAKARQAKLGAGLASITGPTTERAQVAGVLQEMLFYADVRKRLR